MYRLNGLFAAFVILLGAIHSPAAAQDKTLTVFAAASMKNALDEIDAAYTAKSGVKVVASYAASSALAKQLEQGAPADVFISADTDWMDYAIGKKNINEPTRVNLLGNSIVLIAPKDSKIDNVNIGAGFDLAKLAGDGKIATGAWRSRSRHRLFHRCQGRTRRQDRRHLPRRFPSGDHLSRCGDRDGEAGDDGLSRLPALDRGEEHP
jgi:molybdate transport system substrate-binding protein